jgi:hypothetical protein
MPRCCDRAGSSEWSTEGISEVVVSDVPMKPKLLAEIKSNNYLLNTLTAMSECSPVCVSV